MEPTVFSELIVSILGLVVTAIAGGVLAFIKQHTNAQQLAVLEQIADVAVQAAEQQGSPLNELAVDKKTYAMDTLEQALSNYGIKLEPGVLDAAIEAAVLRAFNYDRDYTKTDAPA